MYIALRLIPYKVSSPGKQQLHRLLHGQTYARDAMLSRFNPEEAGQQPLDQLR